MKRYFSIRSLVALGFFATSLVAAFGVYLMMQNEVRKNLQTEFDALLTNYALDIRQIILDKSGFNLLNLETEENLEDKIFPFPHGKSLIELVDTNGLVLVASQSLGEQRIPAEIKDFSVEHQYLEFYFDENDDEAPKLYRGVRVPFVEDEKDEVRGYLLVAVPVDFVESQEKRLKTSLLQITPLFLVLSLLMAWLVSRGVTAAIFRLVANVKDSQQQQLKVAIEVPEWPIEVRTLAEAFQELVHKFQDSAKRQEEFFLVAAHQLKTPLFIVRNEIMGVEGLKESARAKLVEKINDLSSTLQTILDFGRANYDFTQEQMTELHLLDLISNVIVRLSSKAEKKHIHIEIENQGDQNFVLLGEETLIEQALQNLIDNAIFWSPESGRIDVVIRSLEELGSEKRPRVLVAIIDRGPGVPENLRDKLFTPFGNQKSAESTGLGLALVHRVALLHHGRVSYKRESGLTIFGLELPLAQEKIPTESQVDAQLPS
jgi:signal transduction histidine kinase